MIVIEANKPKCDGERREDEKFIILKSSEHCYIP
jgi:hypothetical protein